MPAVLADSGAKCSVQRWGVLDQRAKNEPTQTDEGVGEHDGETYPYNPTLAAVCPVADGSGSPAFVLRERREDPPAHDGTEEHV